MRRRSAKQHRLGGTVTGSAPVRVVMAGRRSSNSDRAAASPIWAFRPETPCCRLRRSYTVSPSLGVRLQMLDITEPAGLAASRRPFVIC